jgi:hypothetical protein
MNHHPIDQLLGAIADSDHLGSHFEWTAAVRAAVRESSQC